MARRDDENIFRSNPRRFQQDLEQQRQIFDQHLQDMQQGWTTTLVAMAAAQQAFVRDTSNSWGKWITSSDETYNRMRRGMTALQTSFKVVTGSMLGFTAAGLRGTAAGASLSLHFQLLSREIANVFLPTITGVLDKLNAVVNWFRSLSGEQQQSILHWSRLTVGLLGTSVLLPKIAAGLQSIRGVMTLLSAHPVLAIVGAVASLFAATEEGQAVFGELVSALKPLVSMVGKLASVIGSVLGPILKWVAGALTAVIRGISGVFSAGAVTFRTPLGHQRLSDIQDPTQRQQEYERRRAQILEQARPGSTGGAIVGATTAWQAAAPQWLTRIFGGRSQVAEALRGATELQEQRRNAASRRRELEPAGGGLEGLGDVYRRLQNAALKNDIPQRQLEQAQRQTEQDAVRNDILLRIEGGISRTRVNVP